MQTVEKKKIANTNLKKKHNPNFINKKNYKLQVDILKYERMMVKH